MSLESAFATFSTGTYAVARTSSGSYLYGEPVNVGPWIASHTYEVGDKVLADGNTYVCATGGTAAASGGPTGDVSPIADGSVVWTFLHSNVLNVDAGVQPLAGRDLQDLAEGQNSNDVRNFYTLVQMRTREPGFEPDVVTYKGEPWRVSEVRTYEMDGISYYACKIERLVVP